MRKRLDQTAGGGGTREYRWFAAVLVVLLICAAAQRAPLRRSLPAEALAVPSADALKH